MNNAPLSPAPTGRRRRRSAAPSDERTLLSPLAMQTTAGRTGYAAILIVLSLLTLGTIVPLIWMFLGGLKQPSEFIQNPPTLFPKTWQWHNFVEAWNDLNLTLYFRNTFLIALGGWLIQIFVSATAAYSLSKLKPRFSKVVLFLFLTTLMVPSSAYLVPQYLAVFDVPIFGWRLVGTWWAIWLPSAASAFTIYLLKSFFDEIPQDLTDAAMIDGANAWQMFTQLVLPLSRPVLAVTSIFAFVGAWKEFFWPLLVLPKPALQPVAVAIYRLQSGEPLNLFVAGLALASIPPLIMFLIFQKQIMSGITLGGVKG